MRFVIVTGMSGAGKSSALKMLEDMGFFCVDNLPIPLIDKFSDLAFEANSEVQKIALGLDIRSGHSLDILGETISNMKKKNYTLEILFLDANDEVLVKRYKETRRKHPLAEAERVDKGIALERERLEFLRKQADYILDTSMLLTRELKQELEKIFVEDRAFKSLYVTILSFGFKYGIPTDSDLVFDVRFIPNPYYVDELKQLTGLDEPVRDFCMKSSVANEFIDKLSDMTQFLIPNYINEGKNQLVISIGCTGGRHRSVALANELYNRLCDNEEYGVRIEHRDIDKDPKKKAL